MNTEVAVFWMNLLALSQIKSHNPVISSLHALTPEITLDAGTKKQLFVPSA